MRKLTKFRRQDLIFQFLKVRSEQSALSVNEISNLLKNEDIDVDLRTIRRDLVELSNSHGLLSTETRPERYYPSKDYEIKYQLYLNEKTLQVLLIALNNLKFTSHEYFKNFSTEAETAILNSLDQLLVDDLKKSKKKYYFDFSTSGKPIGANIKDFEKVMFAIREDKIITCINDSPYKDDIYNKKRRRFAPYLFILTSGIPYLIVKDQQDNKFKKLRATRIKDVRLSRSSFEREDLKEKLNLDNLIGGWGGIEEDSVEIKIICDNFMATYFKERSIHVSQSLKKISRDHYELAFTCSMSFEIIRLLASFGGHIKEISPSEVRENVQQIWASGLKLIS